MPETLSLNVNGSQKLTPVFNEGTDSPSDNSLEWSSNEESVATVDQSGNVTAVGVGEAVITAEALDGSGKYAVCNVTVTTSGGGEEEPTPRCCGNRLL